MQTLDTVGWIHIENNKLLLVASRKKLAYYLPGGKREGTETHLDALFREIYEELDVTLVNNSIQFFDTFTAPAYGEGENVQVIVKCFFARADGIIHPTNEIRDVKFFSYDEYQKQLEKAQVMNVIFAQLKNTGLI